MVQFWNNKDSGSGVGCWRRGPARDLRRIGEKEQRRSEEWCREAKGERDSRRKEWSGQRYGRQCGEIKQNILLGDHEVTGSLSEDSFMSRRSKL